MNEPLCIVTWVIVTSVLAFSFYKLMSSMPGGLDEQNTQIKEMLRRTNEQEIELNALQMKLDTLERTMESRRSFDDKLTSSRRTSFGTVSDSRATHGPREGGFDTTGIVDIHRYFK